MLLHEWDIFTHVVYHSYLRCSDYRNWERGGGGGGGRIDSRRRFLLFYHSHRFVFGRKHDDNNNKQIGRREYEILKRRYWRDSVYFS